MLEILNLASDALGCRISEQLTTDDVARWTEAVEYHLGARERLDLYADMEEMTGIDTEVLTAGLRSAALSHDALARIGRVAVVASEDWLQALYEAQGRLLPDLQLRGFLVEEREAARDWLTGQPSAESDTGPRVLPSGQADVLAYALGPSLDAEALLPLVAPLERQLNRGVRLHLLLRVDELASADPGLLDDEALHRLLRSALPKLEACAIVGGPAWLATLTTLLEPALLPAIRRFADDDESSARQWLGSFTSTSTHS